MRNWILNQDLNLNDTKSNKKCEKIIDIINLSDEKLKSTSENFEIIPIINKTKTIDNIINLTLKDFYPKKNKTRNQKVCKISTLQKEISLEKKFIYKSPGKNLTNLNKFNFIYTKEMFPKIIKFNALQVKNLCKKNSNKFIEKGALS